MKQPEKRRICRERRRRTSSAARGAALALLTTLALLLVPATPALAVRGHEFAGAFGWGVADGSPELQRCQSKAPGEAPKCLPGFAGEGPGQFNAPNAIAVDEATGQVYVVDKGNNRVEIFNASGSEFQGEFNGSGLLPNEGKAAGSGGGAEEIETGKFDEPEAIAVDNDPASPSFKDVYVADTNGHVETKEAPPVIDKFSPSGEYIGQITRNPDGISSEEGFKKIRGVSVDPGGEVWVEEQNLGLPLFAQGAANYTNEVTNKWIAFRSSESGQLSVAAPGFAVDSAHNFYVHNTFGNGDRLDKFSEAGGESGLLSDEVDEEPPTAVGVEAGSNEVYIAHQSNVHRVDASNVSPEKPNAISQETLAAPGTPHYDGVAVNAATLTVYAADAQANRVDVFAPEGPKPPTVQPGSTTVSDVSASSASFAAEVNPRSEPGEKATSYHFEYGPCASAASCPESPYTENSPVPDAALSANYEPDPISAHPQDLLAHTVYHVRVFAKNALGETRGEEAIFTTQGTGAQPLPDGRRFELVSPPDKRGAILFPIVGSGIVQAAANGDAISYLANAPTESGPAGFSQTVQILSRRVFPSWLSEDIATPHEATVGVSLGGNGEYHFFAEDLSSAIVQPVGPFTRAISAQASERTAYLRRNFPPGDPTDPCSAFCFQPLVSGCPGEGEPCAKAVEEVANVPEGTKFGEEEEGKCTSVCGPLFLGASADASLVLLSSSTALSEGAPEGEGGSLYEWSGGRLSLVSVLPGGQASAPQSRPAPGFLNENGTIRIARHSVSSDGSRIVWSAGELNGKKEPTGNRHLYLRRTSGEATTIQLDKPEAACSAKNECKGSANPIFQTASADDSRIFFTDSQPLTRSSGRSDLYECEVEEAEEGQLSCALSDLTPLGASKEEAGVIGLAAGAAEDGSAIYFTANGKLSKGANEQGKEAVAGDCKGDTISEVLESEIAPQRCNLYVHAGGQTRLVAVLSGADFPDWSLRERKGLTGLTARVSPSGRHLAFMSRLPLTKYDNRDAASGKPDEEVFLYDSSANSGQGALVCASCDPSGGRPRGVEYRQINVDRGGLAGGSGIWPEGAWIAASTPGWTALGEAEGFALHQPRYLTDAGRLFFNAADALVPQDANKTEDVYEYEPPSVGDCKSELPTFSPSAGGCVALISSGTGKEESAFLDASESGDDAFFVTAASLLPNQDVDQSRDVYDAHSCSSSPCLPEAPTPPPACEGDACQSPGAPPEDQTPGSLSFQGPGNPTPSSAPPAKHKTPAEVRVQKLRKALAACHRKHNKRKRKTCEARARKLYGAHKAKGRAKKSKKASRGGR